MNCHVWRELKYMEMQVGRPSGISYLVIVTDNSIEFDHISMLEL